MQDLLAGLNDAQRTAVTTIHGPVLTLAGPGSGKTRVLTHRIAYLLQQGIAASEILAVTFTNKAAREMRERMQHLVGVDVAAKVDIGTFHSLAARWLRRDGRAIGLADGWLIYDDDDQQRLIKRVSKELKLPDKPFTPRAISSAISSAKNELLDPEAYTAASRSPESRIYAAAYTRYSELLKVAGAVDFDDLLLLTIELFRTAMLARYHRRYRYILVDEYQDTNRAQYEMVKALARGSGNIFVVGDDDQSIYGWRGADVRNIRRFESDFAGAQVIILAENYRSTQAILDVAQVLIDAAPKRTHRKLLRGQTPGGDAVTWRECSDQNEESQRVCDAIETLVKNGASRYADCAIMYRTNAQSRAFEEALSRRRIPYVVIGGMRFYERREIKDVLAWLRLLSNPNDDVSLVRAIEFPSQGIGAGSIAHLSEWASQHNTSLYQALLDAAADSQAVPTLRGAARQRIMSFGARLYRLVKRAPTLTLLDAFDEMLTESQFIAGLVNEHGGSDAESRVENVNELRRVAGEYAELPADEQLPRFLEEVALVADVDRLAAVDNHVVCITLHQAKGLEYDNVFLVGLEDELIPHGRTHNDPVQIEEERRILYVGVTRARKRLALSRVVRRLNFGRYDQTLPSRFLGDIPKGMLAYSTALGSVKPTMTGTRTAATFQGWGTAAAHKPAIAAVHYDIGDIVRHQRFGEGVVLAAKAVDDDVEVVVRFADSAVGEKRLIASFARLEKISGPR